ncbi:hypothetical protein ECHLIB_0213 [Ehrlichia chaffeensis str. Liberty]|uniref:MotE family protein n=1 Tax=Ehrlichia chaffeensis TaxID=945 RepID=UPI000444AA13|nr:hypothetical protein [Ehrlichia chaffeensis]AHX05302.1 hypothetical protein ECHJAX_0216 [Ehrlichia chaffeensis str. Jax]AHX06290.1 hypothetical protein ECHLIB_0213 [Ehrlichia chaffeensis str. Liberty]
MFYYNILDSKALYNSFINSMQVIYIVNVILIFCITGVVLHNFYGIDNDKIVEFGLLNDVEFVKSDDCFFRDSNQKIKLFPVNSELISVVDLQDWYYRLLEQENSLKDKEALLKIAGQHNNDQMLYLEEMKKNLVSLINISTQNYDEKVHGLVKIYESIPVELAAEVFELLDIDSLMLIANNIDKDILSDILLHASTNVVEKIKEISANISKQQCNDNNGVVKNNV